MLIPLLASAAARTIVAICGELNKSFGFVLTRVNSQRETLNTSSATHLRKLGVLLPAHVQERTSYVRAWRMARRRLVY